MPPTALIRWIVLGTLAFSTGLRADNLPPAPTYLGDIRRNEHGQLIAVPSTDPIPAEQSPQPLPATSVRTLPQADPPAARPAAPTANAAVSATKRKAPDCLPQAITCIEITSTADKAQSKVPLTFGQPFRAGDLARKERLVARDNSGATVPLQIDEESTYQDGSLRYAVLSMQLTDLKPNEQRVVSFFRDRAAGSSPPRMALQTPVDYDFKLSAKIYSPQISIITLGNRTEGGAGYPFEAGEQVTIVLGDAPEDRFTLTVAPDQAGGDFLKLTKLADSFIALINGRSRNYRAYKPGPGMGFEKIWVTPRSNEGHAFAVRFVYGGKAKLHSQVIQEYQPPRQYHASAKPALERAIADGKPGRLDGAVTREYALAIPFTEVGTGGKHPQLTARLHIRLHEGGSRIRTDMVLENNWAYEPQPGNVMYELSVSQNNKLIHRQEAFTHYHHARWHKVFWAGDAPKIRLRHHMPYFLASRATWNYDTALPIPEHVLAAEADRLAKADTRPMGPAFVTTYFPGTGGRHDIGPLPRWTALFLVTQDPRAEASMLANADAAAGIPIHYRDAATDQPVSILAHPGLALQLGKSSAKDAPPPMRNDATIWSPDTAHQASFAYVPYLVTGDLFYLDEVMFWANWNLAHTVPEYREWSRGLMYSEQVRGQAWGLRSVGEAVRALPDKHPMSAYFKAGLNNNLKWYVDHFPRNSDRSSVSPLGFLELRSMPGSASYWQSDFLALVMGQLAESGDIFAAEYFRWLTRFTVGRFLHEDEGYCRPIALNYKYLKVRDESGKPIDNWGKLFRTNWPEIPKCRPDLPLGGYPESASGFAAYAKAMLAVAVGLDIDGARSAYDWLQANTPSMPAAMAQDPTWAIVPRQDTIKGSR